MVWGGGIRDSVVLCLLGRVGVVACPAEVIGNVHTQLDPCRLC